MPKTSNEIKELVRKAHFNGDSSEEIAERYDVKLTTVRKIIGHIGVPRVGYRGVLKQSQRPKKISPEMVAAIKSWLDEDCSITLEDIVAKIGNQYNVSVHRDTVKRYVDGFYYSFNRVPIVPRNAPEDIETRLQYAKMFEKMEEYSEKIIFIDETHVQVFTRLNNPPSLDLRKSVTKRSKHFSICAAMGIKSLIFYGIKDVDTSTSNITHHAKDFIDHLASNSITNAWILMGKAGVEQMEEVKKIFSETDHELLFIPPCAPYLNPIESLFRQLKEYVKLFLPFDADRVFNSVKRIPELVDENECQKYYQNMKTYIQRCLAEEIITE